MKKPLLITLFALLLPWITVAAQDELNTYQKTYAEACQWLQDWQSDKDIFTTLRTKYNALSTACTKYAPDSIDVTSTTELKTATTKLTSAISGLKTVAESSKNTQKQVTKTTFDPNFHIYLCFGQSNMEGNATPELVDYSGSSTRFLTMAAVNMSTHSRTKGKWYVARPPLCRDWTGLTPADYFGKTLIKQLPDSITVGVINVALGGCAIEMFLKQGDELKSYLSQQADWLQGYARDYNNEPYDQLIALARQAQKVGVIHGVLLHQGCSNNTQQDWPQKVNVIYQRMLRDLNLSQDEVPLLVGELLSQAQGGVCWGHNSVIAKCPSVIANSHVVSSKDCPGASDGLHFTAQGYRMIGANYANVMRPMLDRYIPNRNLTVGSLKARDASLSLMPGATRSIYMMLTDADGKQHDVTAACTFTSSDPSLLSFKGVEMSSSSNVEGDATVTATYTNSEGQEASADFTVSVRMFPLAVDCFNPSLISTGTFTTPSGVGRFRGSAKGSMGGWYYPNGIDLSAYRYLVVDLATNSVAKQSIRIYDTTDPSSSSYYKLEMAARQKQFVIDLQNMTTADGKRIDPSHVCILGFVTSASEQYFSISGVRVTNEDPTSLQSIIHSQPTTPGATYDLSGRRTSTLRSGIYIQNGRKIVR